MQSQIFVVGSFIMGLTIEVSRLPVAGETLMGQNFNQDVGGKGFNQAMAAARAGANVKILMCIGKDAFGTAAKKAMQKENIPEDHLHELENVKTGCGFVTLMESGDNAIVIDAAANSKLSVAMVRKASDDIAKSAIVMAQLEIPGDSVEEAFMIAKAHDRITILNPAPARKISSGILTHTDFLTPNETEAKIILGISPGEELPMEKIAEKLLQTGAKTIIMTRGREGASIITKKGIKNIPAPKIHVKDTTGCGDCFNGNFAKAISDGKTVEEAVYLAVYAGSYSAQHLGVSKGLPTAGELSQFIQTFAHR
ncbi:MAG: ribokinase [Chitinophagaceae bacterium]